MKRTWLLNSSRILIGLWVLALMAVAPLPAQADEIWVDPVPAAKKSLGNWSNSPVKQKKFVTFKWRVPDDYNGGSDSARIVLVSLKDQELFYEISTSRANDGNLLLTDALESGPFLNSRSMSVGELDEITVPLPGLAPGDYIAVKFRNTTKKSKIVVLGLIYTYPGDWNPGSGNSLTTFDNVGINTSSPVQELHVQGDTYVSGNTGLGTSAPQQKLHVVGTTFLDGRSGIRLGAPATNLHVGAAGTNSTSLSTHGLAVLGSINSSNLSMDTNEIQARFNGTSNRLDLNRSGGSVIITNSSSASRVGIGTFSPAQKLHVAGNTYVSGSMGLGTSSPLQKLDVRGNGYFSSRVGVGTSSPVTSVDVRSGTHITLSKSNPGYILVGDINSSNLALDTNEVTARNNGAASTLWLNPFGGHIRMSSTSSADRVGIGTSSPVQKLDVRGIIIANSYQTHSDRRLKKNIETLENTLDKVMALKPTLYHFRTEDDSDSKHFGLIAQELKEVFPEVVKIQEGNFEGMKDMHAVKYTELIPVLIKGMQEQQVIIQDLEEKLEDQQKQQLAYQELEGMVRKMKQKLDRLEQAGWTLAENK